MKEFWMDQMEERDNAYDEEVSGDEDFNEYEYDYDGYQEDTLMFVAYRFNINDNATMEEVQNYFWGRAESLREWMIDRLKSTGKFDAIPEYVRPYINWTACAKQLQKDGYVDFVDFAGWIWAFGKCPSSQNLTKQETLVAATNTQGR
jgi:hypothetical protein